MLTPVEFTLEYYKVSYDLKEIEFDFDINNYILNKCKEVEKLKIINFFYAWENYRLDKSNSFLTILEFYDHHFDQITLK
jgi:hypothetical protein